LTKKTLNAFTHISSSPHATQSLHIFVSIKKKKMFNVN
jgi:hypothetical protein